MTTKVYPVNYLGDYKYTVILGRHQGKWVLCKHKKRTTWETAGGHIEPGETPLDCAARELQEETGAQDFTLRPIFDYWAGDPSDNARGMVFLAEIERLRPLDPDFEMEQIGFFERLPENLTYPGITPHLIAEYDKLFSERPPFLWHASPTPLTVLDPKKARGNPLENGDRNGVYAYETANQTIPFAFPYTPNEAGNWALYIDDMTSEVWISAGSIDFSTASGYLYRLPADTFTRLDHNQWLSETPVTPLETIPVFAKDHRERFHMTACPKKGFERVLHDFLNLSKN